MTGPAPNCPLLMPSGTPNERSVKALLLPAMRKMVFQPSSQPSPMQNGFNGQVLRA